MTPALEGRGFLCSNEGAFLLDSILQLDVTFAHSILAQGVGCVGAYVASWGRGGRSWRLVAVVVWRAMQDMSPNRWSGAGFWPPAIQTWHSAMTGERR